MRPLKKQRRDSGPNISSFHHFFELPIDLQVEVLLFLTLGELLLLLRSSKTFWECVNRAFEVNFKKKGWNIPSDLLDLITSKLYWKRLMLMEKEFRTDLSFCRLCHDGSSENPFSSKMCYQYFPGKKECKLSCEKCKITKYKCNVFFNCVGLSLKGFLLFDLHMVGLLEYRGVVKPSYLE